MTYFEREKVCEVTFFVSKNFCNVDPNSHSHETFIINYERGPIYKWYSLLRSIFIKNDTN